MRALPPVAALLISCTMTANAKVVSLSIIDRSAMTITADPELSVAFNPLYGWDGGLSRTWVEQGLIAGNRTQLAST